MGRISLKQEVYGLGGTCLVHQEKVQLWMQPAVGLPGMRLAVSGPLSDGIVISRLGGRTGVPYIDVHGVWIWMPSKWKLKKSRVLKVSKVFTRAALAQVAITQS